jgi:hypothetical protein
MVSHDAPACPAYVLQVLEHLRERDALELFATRFDNYDRKGTLALHREIITTCKYLYVFGRARAVVVVGAQEFWPGRWSVCAFATDEFTHVVLAVTRFVKRVMIPALIRDGAQRAQCASHAKHTDAHRWLEMLGAEHEGTLRSFGKDGADFLVYRWLRTAS